VRVVWSAPVGARPVARCREGGPIPTPHGPADPAGAARSARASRHRAVPRRCRPTEFGRGVGHEAANPASVRREPAIAVRTTAQRLPRLPPRGPHRHRRRSDPPSRCRSACLLLAFSPLKQQSRPRQRQVRLKRQPGGSSNHCQSTHTSPHWGEQGPNYHTRARAGVQPLCRSSVIRPLTSFRFRPAAQQSPCAAAARVCRCLPPARRRPRACPGHPPDRLRNRRLRGPARCRRQDPRD